MANKSNSVLVVGFNTRPLTYSLNKAGYRVYTVDFFGDLDLYPNVEDYIIVQKALKSNYETLKDKYSEYLAQFTIQLHQRHRNVKFLLIGSGLDDAYNERELILDEIKNFDTISVNNKINVLRKSRDFRSLFEILKNHSFKVPSSFSLENFQLSNKDMLFPLILKKKYSAGGINVFKVEDRKELLSLITNLKNKKILLSEWLIQEYIEGISVSCTVISNGKECEIVTINRQIIGKKFLNSPKEFMYCGNIVPAGLSKSENELISEIALVLTKELGLIGINGFDFVLRDHYPYLMECNPRIPGSIRASESALNINLLDLHIRSFDPNKWNNITKIITSAKIEKFATKLVYFAPKDIGKTNITKINNLEFVHDKSEPIQKVSKGAPLCTILYEANSLSESYNGAKIIVNTIDKIISPQ
ncbi:MAG: ATP-grasp domain-containing protein [Candidatus Thorarchaeota archaeon]